MSETTNTSMAEETADELLELPADVDLADARLRRAAAWVALPASIAVGVASTSGFVRAFAVLGVLASIGWLVSAARTSREARTRPASFLRLGNVDLLLVEGEVRRSVPYAEVVDVEVDEERVAVRVVGRDGAEWLIRPGYGRLGLLELHERIAGRVRRSRDSSLEPGARNALRG